jgi:hypothetical protein
MKKFNIEKGKLKWIINDLKKVSDTFDGLGCCFWDLGIMSEDEQKQYGDAELLLTATIKKLKKLEGT